MISRPDCPRCVVNCAPGVEHFQYHIPADEFSANPAHWRDRVWFWNISLVKAIIQVRPREAHVVQIADVLSPTLNLTNLDYPHLEHVDPYEPTIIAPLAVDGAEVWMLIDGIHRTKRRQLDGLETVRVYPLTGWESLLSLFAAPGLPLDRSVFTLEVLEAIKLHGEKALDAGIQTMREWVAGTFPEFAIGGTDQ